MSRPHVDPLLMMRAAAAFKRWRGTLPTGAEGLTRGELRRLERAGVISHVQKKLPSGSIVNVWTWEAR
jgi:hypothetical protein